MRKLIQFLFFGLVLLTPFGLCAQGTLFEKERELVKVSTLVGDTAFLDIRCGEYFVFGQLHVGDGQPPRIAYWQEKKPTDPEHVQLTGFFLPGKFVVRIDSTKKVPTVKLVLARGEIQRVVVRINRGDYEKCKCLPKPTESKTTLSTRKK